MNSDVRVLLHYATSETAGKDVDMRGAFVERINEKYRSLYDKYSPNDMTQSDFSRELSALKAYALKSVGAEDCGGQSAKEIAERARRAAIWLDSFIHLKASDSD